MKKIVKPVVTLIFFAVVVYSVYYKSLASQSAFDDNSVFISPIAKRIEEPSITKYQNSILKSYSPDSEWQVGEHFGTATQPEISSRSGILIDLQTGKILFDKNSKEQMKIASLTKIMTAVLVLEHKDLSDRIYIDDDSSTIGENIMGVSSGEVYTVEELLYGLILHSGNDAAYALAKGTAGDVRVFIDWMNFKAKDLGLTNTFFADPSGLDDDTYSTAEDLVKLTRYALKNPDFKTLIKVVNKEIIGDDHKYLYLENQTNLLTTYPGVAGVKTGYTEEAGLCLVTYAENDGREVLGAVLNSIDRKGDMILMLDHGFGTLGVRVVHHLLDY